MTDMLCQLANGKVILALEGGYNLDSISKSALECVKVLFGEKPAEIQTKKELEQHAVISIENVKRTHKKYWKCFEGVEELTEKLRESLVITAPSSPSPPSQSSPQPLPSSPTLSSASATLEPQTLPSQPLPSSPGVVSQTQESLEKKEVIMEADREVNQMIGQLSDTEKIA